MVELRDAVSRLQHALHEAGTTAVKTPVNDSTRGVRAARPSSALDALTPLHPGLRQRRHGDGAEPASARRRDPEALSDIELLLQRPWFSS